MPSTAPNESRCGASSPSAVGASLLIGTVSAEEGSAPEPPPVLDPPVERQADFPTPRFERPPLPPGIQATVIETGSVNPAFTNVASAASTGMNVGAMSDYKCAYIKVVQRGIFWTRTEWCFDGTLIVRGYPALSEGTHTVTYTTVKNGVPQQITERGTDPIVWKVSGGLGSRTHHDKGLAHHYICIRNLVGPDVEVGDTYSNALEIEKWVFGTGASHGRGKG